MTNGVDIESILYDYLTQNSAKFQQFKILSKPLSSGEPQKQIDFLVECTDRFNANLKKRLNVVFFIADCHNDNSLLEFYIQKAQIYKVLSNSGHILPIQVHEEIVELMTHKKRVL